VWSPRFFLQGNFGLDQPAALFQPAAFFQPGGWTPPPGVVKKGSAPWERQEFFAPSMFCPTPCVGSLPGVTAFSQSIMIMGSCFLCAFFVPNPHLPFSPSHFPENHDRKGTLISSFACTRCPVISPPPNPVTQVGVGPRPIQEK